MKVAVLGTGDVGRTLGKAFLALGHEVKMGSRDANNEELTTWVKENGPKASGGTFEDAAKFGDIIVLATLGQANESALKLAGADNVKGKLLIDTTNPLEFSSGGPKLFVGHTDSGGEQVQRFAPTARVVKAFNTVGHAHMFKPSFAGGPPTMFICGNDDGAKKEMTEILTAFGWETADIGGIEQSKHLESMCIVWVSYAFKNGGWNHAFKLLKK